MEYRIRQAQEKRGNDKPGDGAEDGEEAQQKARPQAMDNPVILGVGAALIIAVGVWIYIRGRTPPQEMYSHFRCPGCRRRLRYKRQQVGHKGECSNCGRAVIFPPIS